MLKREEQLHAALHEALAMNDELLGILESVEWHQQRYNGSPACPCCGAQQHWGHEEGCELAAAIGVRVLCKVCNGRGWDTPGIKCKACDGGYVPAGVHPSSNDQPKGGT